jgi:Flp pilus assembly protein TadG
MTGPRRLAIARLTRAIAAHLSGSERGITFVIFALAIVVLLGMVAVGIDGGRLFDERRHAQNAADHAALAAAYASCLTDASAAQAAGLASAESNGYDTDAPGIDVTITPGGEADEYVALVETTIPTTFARVMGFATMSTSGEATGQATGCDASGASPAAIYAGGNNCDPGSLRNIEISGNDHTVNGLTYTNGSFSNTGDGSDFINAPDPSVKYVSSFAGDLPGGNTYTAPAAMVPLPPADDRWPDGFDPNPTTGDMTDAMWNAFRDSPNRRNSVGGNNQSTIVIVASGIYYTEYNSTVSVTSIAPGAHFTVASKRGPVTISGDYTARTFEAYENNPSGTPANLMLLSGFAGGGQPCDQFAFERSGNGGTWTGMFWTPRAMSRWNGNESTINGGFVTWAFQMNGNEHIINGGTGEPSAHPDITLEE